MTMAFKSGFVNIIGKPNVGKSTLINKLVGEKLSIVSPKAQTTRKRAMGIVTTSLYQIIFSDTPGVLAPHYELHKSMMNYVHQALEDADVLITVSEPNDSEGLSPEIWTAIAALNKPLIHLINKSDLVKDPDQLENIREKWKTKLPAGTEVYLISALHGIHTHKLMERVINLLPEHPAYFPEDDLTDQTERFLASEIIREHIFLLYQQEIPYCSEVKVEAFKDTEEIIRIQAMIYVERESQKPIVIGNKGLSIKKLGTDARKEMEKFFQKKVYLELTVKVLKDWRNNPALLNRFGYKN
jgi:GTP-binding protein Era